MTTFLHLVGVFALALSAVCCGLAVLALRISRDYSAEAGSEGFGLVAALLSAASIVLSGLRLVLP